MMQTLQALANSLGLPLIAVAVPMLVALVKKYKPNVPKPLLPILAAVFGPLCDLAISYAAGVPANTTLAVVAGLAGVGVREIKDQVGQALAE